MVEAAFVAGDDDVSLTSNTGKAFHLNLKSMHEIREENGTARPIQRKLTSQLQQQQQQGTAQTADSAEEDAKKSRHVELTAGLTRDLLPVLLEVS